MKKFKLLFYLSLSFITLQASAQELKVKKPVAKAMQKVKPKAIEAHIRYLADDKLMGRKPGTEGFRMAADYVIDQFQALGVKPAGEDNTYLQHLTIRKATPGAAASITSLDKDGKATNLAHEQDFVIYPNPKEEQITVEAPLVFAGFGISSPELGYDDYANIDAKGKIVVIVRGAPTKFPNTVASNSTDLLTILKTAADHGAVGVMMGNISPSMRLPNLRGGINSVIAPNGSVAASRTYVSEDIKLLASINYNTFASLLSQADVDPVVALTSMREGVTVSAALNHTVKVNYTSSFEDIQSFNVVGKIEGSDELLKNQYVVHSAHLDHVGIGRPVNGDSIYNGAHDNASGVASLLEIAKIYSNLKEKPKRSVLIVMVTAEEMGLLGSAYFASNPTVPKQNIVANINTDMPTIIAPLLSATALGADHSSLAKQVEAAGNYLGIEVEPDPEPNQNRFVRSDQYSFVIQGIPSLHIKYGNKTADGKNNLNEQVEKWRAIYYHKPQDQIDGTFDFDAGKKYVQLNFLIGYQVAQNAERPTWNPGDFFGERFQN
ncbi:M28 family peptidase [Pontibacter harenae]|uniref:M28 family peptidase n=1 Tax=Pontibacter harenae TaxID=2894083 RepID=UPI001E322F3B|nr:M28 family peptidase [Pontibacter harenae]MCC9167955.1 M28 family peptidase [Pontibacter harenae]